MKIVFSSDRDGSYDLYTLKMDSNENVKLPLSVDGDKYGPYWSSDGDQLYFLSKLGDHTQLLEYTFDSDFTREIYSSDNEMYGVSISPDNSLIVWNQIEKVTSSLVTYDLHADKAYPRMITTSREDVFPFRVSWISNSEILYTSSGKIHRMDIHSRQRTTIEMNASFQLNREWYKRKKKDIKR